MRQRREGRRHRQALPRLVERQRHSRALLDSARDGRKLRADRVPLAARTRARLRARAQRRRQRRRAPQRPGQRTLQRALRVDDRHGLHGPRRRGRVDRSDSGREDRHEDALPLAADRRRAGIARRERAPQHDVGRLRARAAAGTHSAEPVRSPVRRAGTKAGSTARRACSTSSATTCRR